MPRYSHPSAYTGRKANKDLTGQSRLATDAEAIAQSSKERVITPSNLAALGVMKFTDVTLTSAQVKALAATQIELVPAQGAGKAILFMGALLKMDYGTNVFVDGGNLQINYVDGDGVNASAAIEAAGFLTLTADSITNAIPAGDALGLASVIENVALVLDNNGAEITGNAANDSTLTVRTFYQVVSI